jgi:hypothetical protein
MRVCDARKTVGLGLPPGQWAYIRFWVALVIIVVDPRQPFFPFVSAIKPYEGFGVVDHTTKELMSL